MSSLKPIKVYGKGPTPNPVKVAIILRQLGLAYEIEPVDHADVKKPAYTAINPNGRLPSIHDPNTGITVWESGAIFEYLVAKYDSEHKISFTPDTPEFYHAKQWLHFQMSGQGPYYGQVSWFSRFHHEKLPSAIERYTKEVNRVTGVLDAHLAEQKGGDGPWLVGNKMTYADLAFVPWQRLISMVIPKEEFDEDKYPHVKKWLGKMLELDSVKEAIAESS